MPEARRAFRAGAPGQSLMNVSARGATAGMLLATLLWGGTFVVLRESLAHQRPVTLVFARFAIATLVWALVLILRPRPISRAAWIGGLVSGALTAGGYLFQAIGLTTTSAGSSAFLTCAGTLFAGLFAWPLLGLRPSGLLGVGLLLALSGSALLGIRGQLALGPGEAWTLLGALLYALQVVAVAGWAAASDPIALTAIQAAVTALVLAPFAGGAVSELARLDPPGWWRLGYLAAAGTVAAPLLQVRAQRVLSPGRVGLLFALEPVFALAFALTLGGERFVPRWWAGAALIVFAVLLVEGRSARISAASSRAATGGAAA